MKQILLMSLVLILGFTTGIKADNENQEPVETYPYPVNFETLPMVSENYILVDRKTGVIVGGKNIDEKVHFASITKVFTALAALERIESEGKSLSDQMVISPNIFPIDTYLTIAQFNPDDKFTYDDVIYGLMLPSGADAANALSYDLTGSSEGLADNMNQLAQKIGMTNTHFTNVTGADDDAHLSTVKDLALGLEYALENEDFMRYYKADRHTSAPSRMHKNGISWVDSTLERAQANNYSQIIGAKSGTTQAAERSVSLLIDSKGDEYIYISTNATLNQAPSIVVHDAMKVVNDLEMNYQRYELYLENQTIDSKKVLGLAHPLEFKFPMSQLYYLDATQNPNSIRYEFIDTPSFAIKGIKKGDKIATMNVYHEEDLIYTEAVYAQTDTNLSVLMILLLVVLTLLGITLIVLLVALIYSAIMRKLNRTRRKKTLRNNR